MGPKFVSHSRYRWSASLLVVLVVGIIGMIGISSPIAYGITNYVTDQNNQLMATSAYEVGENDFRISDMGIDGDDTSDAQLPATAYNSIDHEFLVVWSGNDLPDGRAEIYAQRIDAATGEEIGQNDFQISDIQQNVDPKLDAVSPKVVYNPTVNEYLVMWEGFDTIDDNISTPPGLFAQRLDGETGAEVGQDDFRIDTPPADLSTYSVLRSAIAYNSTNNEYMAVWEGDPPEGNNSYAILGQRLSATGSLVGEKSFVINDSEPGSDPDITYNETTNEYFVAWSGGGIFFDPAIYGQILDGATGAERGTNDFQISNIGGRDFFIYEPEVAYNTVTNEYLAIWLGDEGDDFIYSQDIYGQRLSITGQQLGPIFRITDMKSATLSGYLAMAPELIFNPTDNQYLLTWYAVNGFRYTDEYDPEIYGQVLDGATGAEIGLTNFRISTTGPDGDNEYRAYDPTIAYNSQDNEFLVAWWGDEISNEEFEIFGQRLSTSSASSEQLRISDMGPDGDKQFDAYAPAIAYNSQNHEYLAVWSGNDTESGAFEIHGQRLDATTGEEIGENDFQINQVRANIDPGFRTFSPNVVYNPTTNQYLVVWSTQMVGEFEEASALTPSINGQLIDAETGAEVGENDFRIDQAVTDGEYIVYGPAIAYNQIDNQYLITWNSNRGQEDFRTKAVGQRLDAQGAAIGENIAAISDSTTTDDLDVVHHPAANQYLVVWSGEKIASETDGQALDDSDSQDSSRIYGQRLDANGVEIGTDDFPISDSFLEDTLSDQAAFPESFTSFITNRPAVTYNSDTEEFMVVWSDGFDTSDNFIGFDINGRRLDADGEKQGSELQISVGDDIGFIHDYPDVVYNPLDEEYLVTWAVDNLINFDGVEWEVYGQRLNGATGEDVGADDFRISRMGPEGDNMNYQALTPALAYNSRDNAYLVTWAGDDNTGALVEDEFEIYGKRLAGQNNPDPTPTPTPTTPSATATPTADPVATATPTTPSATSTPTADPVVTPTPTPNVPPVGTSRVFLPLIIR